jgi:hypothetical protein
MPDLGQRIPGARAASFLRSQQVLHEGVFTFDVSEGAT